MIPRQIDSIDLIYMWQIKLGHIWLERIKRSIKEGLLKSLQMSLLPIYESYLEKKWLKDFLLKIVLKPLNALNAYIVMYASYSNVQDKMRL